MRLQERPDQAELVAWDLLRQVDSEVTLSELSAARILVRLEAAARQPARVYPRWLIAAAAVAFSLLGIQVAAAAVFAGVPALRRALTAAVGQRLAHREVLKADASPSAPPPLQVATSVAAPLPAPAPASPGPMRRAGPRVAVAAGSPSRTSRAELRVPSSLPEVEVMTQAARELYADHDAVAALATLEPYLYLHPAGSLRPEMIREAVQADLELDRTPEALGLLDGLAAQNFAGIPRASELRLLRGELLARSHRCHDAVAVFEQALAYPDSGQRERALYGRALCRAELGDLSGNQSDLRDYLEQFPAGRFAGEAERALDRDR